MAIKGVYKTDELARAIMNELEDYVDYLEEEIDFVAEEASKLAVRMLKVESPKRKTNGGTYAKGWRAKKINGAWVVHNATNYQLTHLLEKGHATANGIDRVPAYPHIAPVEEKVVKKYISDIMDVINK